MRQQTGRMAATLLGTTETMLQNLHRNYTQFYRISLMPYFCLYFISFLFRFALFWSLIIDFQI